MMEYMSTEFIVMVTVGLFKWAVAITFAIFCFCLVIECFTKIWTFIFPVDPEEVAHAEDILKDIRLRGEE